MSYDNFYNELSFNQNPIAQTDVDRAQYELQTHAEHLSYQLADRQIQQGQQWMELAAQDRSIGINLDAYFAYLKSLDQMEGTNIRTNFIAKLQEAYTKGTQQGINQAMGGS